VTVTLVMAILVAGVCGVGAAGLYLTWPRRLTAEEYVMHRRAISEPMVPQVAATPSRTAGPDLLAAQLERLASLASIARTDLALLRLAGHQVPASEQELCAGSACAPWPAVWPRWSSTCCWRWAPVAR